ncbi:MAG: methyltransferase [Candidatus Symbiothrix sp.]|jgi:tRNA1Val (adenine37-N6)-methyltransferase|nr:methyltransferase [Candidatus Symbiothrix sp.]
MKVGTDGVLLGAWANCSDVRTILDTGTGSGLIALMLAQRCPAKIDAIDLDKDACRQAQINFGNSPFSDRLLVHFSSLQNFSPERKYDLIVSNPPYFSNSLPSPDKGRTQARHNNTLPFDDLIKKSLTLLSPQGKLALILPYGDFGRIHVLAKENGLFLYRKTTVIPVQNRPPKRILLEYSRACSSPEENELIIEKSPSVYSEAYINLTKDFYLKM